MLSLAKLDCLTVLSGVLACGLLAVCLGFHLFVYFTLSFKSLLKCFLSSLL